MGSVPLGELIAADRDMCPGRRRADAELLPRALPPCLRAGLFMRRRTHNERANEHAAVLLVSEPDLAYLSVHLSCLTP